ncbi:DUF2314 domain-containing protein [Acinetobacter sp. WCHAc060025]|nr:DUF2314 domain-containing protein [Acinetobacter sp. WCHAc060025]
MCEILYSRISRRFSWCKYLADESLFEEGFCYAQPFELPKEFEWIHVGQWLKFAEEDLLDWYILSENGEMKGGYSLRYQRSLLLEDDKAEFDQHIGLSRFID